METQKSKKPPIGFSYDTWLQRHVASPSIIPNFSSAQVFIRFSIWFRVTYRAGPHLWLLVGHTMVDNNVDGLVSWRLGFDGAQHPDELIMPLTLDVAADHASIGDVECSEQGGGGVSLVVVGHGRLAGTLECQPCLHAAKLLDLAFFVSRKQDRMGELPTICASQTCCWGELRPATIASSRTRSVDMGEMLMPIRILHCGSLQRLREVTTGLCRSDQSISDLPRANSTRCNWEGIKPPHRQTFVALALRAKHVVPDQLYRLREAKGCQLKV